jgi:hydroxypyruvate isomerase
MNISICIDAVFMGQDERESMSAISKLGVKAYEFWAWWEKDLAMLTQAQKDFNLQLAACCTRFISLVDESTRSEYHQGLEESIQAAKRLGCKTLISQVGNDLGNSRHAQKKNLVRGLKSCIPFLEDADMQLVFEPLNTLVDHAGYFLTSSEEAFEIVDSVDHPKVKVLYDIYHQQIMEGNLIQRITENIDKIGHFHAAGNPGRNELYYGEINYPAVFMAIDNTGFNGYIGFEYFPIDDPLKGIQAFLKN